MFTRIFLILALSLFVCGCKGKDEKIVQPTPNANANAGGNGGKTTEPGNRGGGRGGPEKGAKKNDQD